MDGRARADGRRRRGARRAQARAARCSSAFGAERGRGGPRARSARSSTSKNADLVVFNDVARDDIGFDADENEVVLVTRAGDRHVAKAPKQAIAAAILDEVERLLGEARVSRARSQRSPAPQTSSAQWSTTSRVVVHAPAETLRLCVLCLDREGHLIIEDFPGVGKTMLAKALARSLDARLLAHAVHA